MSADRILAARCRCGWAIEASPVSDEHYKATLDRMRDLARAHNRVTLGGPHLVQGIFEYLSRTEELARRLYERDGGSGWEGASESLKGAYREKARHA